MSENQRDPQYKLRWSEELRDKIAQSAKDNNRSMNADIVARLEESFSERKFTQDDVDQAIQSYLAGYYAASAAVYKHNIDAVIAKHGEKPENPSDQLFLSVLNLIYKQYKDNANKNYVEKSRNQQPL